MLRATTTYQSAKNRLLQHETRIAYVKHDNRSVFTNIKTATTTKMMPHHTTGVIKFHDTFLEQLTLRWSENATIYENKKYIKVCKEVDHRTL